MGGGGLLSGRPARLLGEGVRARGKQRAEAETAPEVRREARTLIRLQG